MENLNVMLLFFSVVKNIQDDVQVSSNNRVSNHHMLFAMITAQKK